VRAAPVPGKRALGLTGRVPARVDADVKAGLLDLVDHALEQGWSHRRAARVLEIDHWRVGRWTARRAEGRLADLAPGGNPVHGLLDWEVDAILQICDEWGEIDRSHRKLAHRGSRVGAVYVSESTFYRVLLAHGVALPGPPRREPVATKPWPEWVEYRPNQVWGWDATHFPRARRIALAIIDLVSRKWIATLVTSEESSTQVEVVFDRALEAEGLVAEIERRALSPVEEDAALPILLAVSDNGPQMTSGSTAEYMALCSILQHFGRPGTPTDQAPVESFFSHLKGESPHLEQIRDPVELEIELERQRVHYNTVRLHAGIGYVTPDDEHSGRADAIRKARREGLLGARRERVAYHRNQAGK
jgi:putative transposase